MNEPTGDTPKFSRRALFRMAGDAGKLVTAGAILTSAGLGKAEAQDHRPPETTDPEQDLLIKFNDAIEASTPGIVLPFGTTQEMINEAYLYLFDPETRDASFSRITIGDIRIGNNNYLIGYQPGGELFHIISAPKKNAIAGKYQGLTAMANFSQNMGKHCGFSITTLELKNEPPINILQYKVDVMKHEVFATGDNFLKTQQTLLDIVNTPNSSESEFGVLLQPKSIIEQIYGGVDYLQSFQGQFPEWPESIIPIVYARTYMNDGSLMVQIVPIPFNFSSEEVIQPPPLTTDGY